MAPPPQSIAGAAPAAEVEGVVPSAEVPAPVLNGEIKQSPDTKEPAEMDPSGEKHAQMEKSTQELMERLDPNGAVSCMALVSVLYAVLAPWLLWRVAGQPPAFFWTFSLLVCSYLFLWTISVSKTMSIHVVFFRTSYILLLAVAVTHLIGSLNGMLVMYLGTFFAIGMLGYAIAEHCEYIGIDKSANAVVTPSFKSKDHQKRYEEGVFFFCFIISVMSLAILIRMACVIFFPDTRTLFEALEFVIEISGEICGLCIFGITYLTQFELRGALPSMDTILCRVLSYYCVGFLLGVFLSFVVGDAMAILVLWLVTIPIVGYFGYTLAIRTSYRQILARN